ncbi:protein SLC31A2-like [Oculina patagonica]
MAQLYMYDDNINFPRKTTMDMSFVASENVTILFKGWKVSTIGGLVGSCIAVIVIAVFFEGLKSYKGHRHKPCKKNNETTPLIRQPHRIQNRFQVTDHLKKTLLYVVQFLVGYFLMLVAMTYNVWLFLAVVVGCGIGFFLATPCLEYYSERRRKAASQVLDSSRDFLDI